MTSPRIIMLFGSSEYQIYLKNNQFSVNILENVEKFPNDLNFQFHHLNCYILDKFSRQIPESIVSTFSHRNSINEGHLFSLTQKVKHPRFACHPPNLMGLWSSCVLLPANPAAIARRRFTSCSAGAANKICRVTAAILPYVPPQTQFCASIDSILCFG